MEINIKKILKISTLLIMSLLIATASATVYRQMRLTGNITVTAPKLVWIEGEDADASIDGSIATISLTVENGTAMNFTSAIYLKNENQTGSFHYNITIIDGLSSSEFEIAKIHIYDNESTTWSYRDTVDLTNTSDYSVGTLNAGKYLRFTVEIKAINDQPTDTQFIIKVEYWP